MARIAFIELALAAILVTWLFMQVSMVSAEEQSQITIQATEEIPAPTNVEEVTERDLADDGFQAAKGEADASPRYWYYDSGRYVVIKKARSKWQKADDFCLHEYDTHLATVHDEHDWDELRSLWKRKLRTANCWIGCHEEESGRYGYKDREGWYWASGWPYHSDEAYWRSKEPNGEGYESCCFLWHWGWKGYGWDDGRCYWKFDFICDSPSRRRLDGEAAPKDNKH
jgi:hypothetical protein